MSLPATCKTSYVSSSKKRDPRSAGSNDDITAAQSRTIVKPTPQTTAAEIAQPTPIVNLESSGAAATLLILLQKIKGSLKRERRRLSYELFPTFGGGAAELVTKKKVVEDLRAQLEALTLEHKGNNRIVEEAGRLKVEAKRLAENEKELLSQVDSLTAELMCTTEICSWSEAPQLTMRGRGVDDEGRANDGPADGGNA
ncbi:hypothetical protein LR48_Vigan11g108000 [Vigna angularis]|uniref:Uncharacterized protein n=1 Tax=Phaseolus angularis TaxID=3914 RepID=A0A0L9VT68_PHAAN|nr:hypothetical protein LR48_Vigan11g108000 [Vigna angularis]